MESKGNNKPEILSSINLFVYAFGSYTFIDYITTKVYTLAKKESDGH